MMVHAARLIKMDSGKEEELKKNIKEPYGFVLKETDNNTGSRYGWVPVEPTTKNDRYLLEAYKDNLEYGTYELCGPKIQGNPEGYSIHVLIKHSEAEKYRRLHRSREAIMNFLRDNDIEGIVFHHPDGRMCKIKNRDFGVKRNVM